MSLICIALLVILTTILSHTHFLSLTSYSLFTIYLIFSFLSTQFFVRLENIRKCFTLKGGIFVIEELSKSCYPCLMTCSHTPLFHCRSQDSSSDSTQISVTDGRPDLLCGVVCLLVHRCRSGAAAQAAVSVPVSVSSCSWPDPGNPLVR